VDAIIFAIMIILVSLPVYFYSYGYPNLLKHRIWNLVTIHLVIIAVAETITLTVYLNLSRNLSHAGSSGVVILLALSVPGSICLGYGLTGIYRGFKYFLQSISSRD